MEFSDHWSHENAKLIRFRDSGHENIPPNYCLIRPPDTWSGCKALFRYILVSFNACSTFDPGISYRCLGDLFLLTKFFKMSGKNGLVTIYVLFIFSCATIAAISFCNTGILCTMISQRISRSTPKYPWISISRNPAMAFQSVTGNCFLISSLRFLTASPMTSKLRTTASTSCDRFWTPRMSCHQHMIRYFLPPPKYRWGRVVGT